MVKPYTASAGMESAKVTVKASDPRSPARLLSSAGIFAIVVGAMLPEWSTARFGQPSLVASILPGSPPTAIPAALIVAGVAVVLATVTIPGLKRGAPWPGVRIWLPYGAVWLVGALLGDRIPVSAQYLSWLIFLALSLIPGDEVGAAVGRGGALIVGRTIVWGSLLVAILAPGRSFAPANVWPGGWVDGAQRLQGATPHPNTLGYIAAVLLVTEVLWQRGPWKVGTVLLAFVALALSTSRTPVISLLIALTCVVLVAMIRRDRNAGATAWTAIAVATLAAPLAVLWLASARLNFNGRTVTWSAALSDADANPLIGRGPGLQERFIASGADLLYAHNQILQTVAELGLVGLAALLLHVLYLTRWAWGGPLPVVMIVTFWVSAFLTENVFRFAYSSFAMQIAIVQLAIAGLLAFAANGDETS